MTDPSDAAQDFVLYGLDDKGKPRAGLVPVAEGDAALVLAGALNLQLLLISTAQRPVLSAELAPVSLSENGYSAVPAIRRALFAEIEKAAHEQENSSPEPMAGAGTEQASITPWEEIKVGQVVLAQEENPKDGWWEAIVLSARRRRGPPALPGLPDAIPVRSPQAQAGSPEVGLTNLPLTEPF